MALKIRAARREDLASLAESLGRHHEYFLDRFPLQERGSGEVLLAFEDGRPVGGVLLWWDQATEPEVRRHLPGVPMIQHLHVDPARRHRGIGTALLRQAEAHLRARGHRRVLLGVNQSNPVARELYLRLGYVEPAEPDLRDLPAAGGAYDILVADL